MKSLTVVFFFFQAEDGIRDLTVTGVQTCALPIFRCPGTPYVLRWFGPLWADNRETTSRSPQSFERRDRDHIGHVAPHCAHDAKRATRCPPSIPLRLVRAPLQKPKCPGVRISCARG